MKISTFISVKNLELAWRRINTGRNNQFKRFFRTLYLGYEAGLQQNLKLLHKKLNAGWEPQTPTRIYLPKPSGLQRPITLLNIEDQIVFQAIANIFAVKIEKRRRKVELHSVFSHILSNPSDSIFFVHQWQKTYIEFQKACKKIFEAGYRWVAHFDLAAYYDTISHEQLVRIVIPRETSEGILAKFEKWFGVWTEADGSPSCGHGIPQGPIASDFLAEVFFLPIDERMEKLSVRYVRYGDDIRIFAKSIVDVQTAAVQLELACRSHGLIPQGKKFEISEATSIDEVMGQLPSIPPEGEGEEDQQMEVKEAELLMKEAIIGRPLRVKDKSRLRYVLYRAPKSKKILTWVLKLIKRHPEHIDAFSHYISNFKSSRRIVRAVSEMLKSGVPYGYVRGELWHILARCKSRSDLDSILSEARSDAHKKNRCIAWNWGLIDFFISCCDNNLAQYKRLVQTAQPLSKTLLASRFDDHFFSTRKLASRMLSEGTLEEGISIALEMRKRGLYLAHFGLKNHHILPELQNILKGLGIIRRRNNLDRDYLGEKLSALFGIPNRIYWNCIFKDEYEHALQILLEAIGAFEINPSHWVQLQNSFNDSLVRLFISYLEIKKLPGVVKITERSGKLIKFGVIVQSGSSLDTNYPIITAAFRNANNRRNKLPASHPYDDKSGHQTKFLKHKERNKIRGELSNAYNKIVEVIDVNGIQ